jgi:hypothetical protein
MSIDAQTQIDELNATVATLNSSLTQITGNTLTNYNQLTKINSQQGNITTALTNTAGLITSGNVTCGNIISKYGLGLGMNDNTLTGILQMNDNFSNNVHTAITLSNISMPYQTFTRQTKFLFHSTLTSGVTKDILTINHNSPTSFDERSIYIYIDGMICASTTSDSSTKSFNAYIIGSRANNTSQIYTYSTTQITSTTSATTSGTLNIGTTTITFPTNTTSKTNIALTQTMTGTPSQALFITGMCTVYTSDMNGFQRINSIAIF